MIKKLWPVIKIIQQFFPKTPNTARKERSKPANISGVPSANNNRTIAAFWPHINNQSAV